MAKKKTAVVSPYTATLNVLGKNYVATGDSISDAIGNVKPGNVRGKAILTLSKDGKSKERILMPMAVLRLFNTAGLTREVNLKNVTGLFSGFDG